MSISTDVTITADNLVSYYKSFVVDVANGGISWASNSYPHGYFPGGYLDGNTAGRTMTLDPATLQTASGGLIDASDIYNNLIWETEKYTVIRHIRAILYLSGYGTVYDSTQKSYMTSAYYQYLDPIDAGGVVTDATITASELEAFFYRLRDNWATKQNNVITVENTYCHSSCHSNCHSSRGRR